MNRNKIGGAANLLLALILAVGVLFAFEYKSAKTVKADTGDQWANFYGSASSVGTVITAITGVRPIIKEVILTSTASLTVALIEHPATGSDIVWGNIGVLANTPIQIPQSFFNGSYGWVFGVKSEFRVQNENAAAGTVSLNVRYASN